MSGLYAACRSIRCADIDYATAESLTTFGRIGIKVWVYRGDVLPTAGGTESAEGAE